MCTLYYIRIKNKREIKESATTNCLAWYCFMIERLRAEVIRLYYDIPVGGHKGQWKTMELVTRNFW